MGDSSEIIKVKKEPEFVACHNNDDVELALDPFADSGNMVQVKEEYVEPSFEDFDVNEVRVVQFKEEPNQNAHDDYDCDNFDGGNDFHDEFDDFPSYDDVERNSPIDTSMISTALTEKTVKTEKQIELEVKDESDVEDINKIIESPGSKVNKTKQNAKKTTSTKLETKSKPESKTESEVKSEASVSKTGVKKKGRPKSQDEHKCMFCGKCYQYASLLKLHTRTHMLNKGHNCPLCGKSFARADHCKQHLNNVHKGEVVDGVVRKPTFEATCEICSKVFHHSGNLRKHMVLHSGERPFSCDECGRTFVLNLLLFIS